MSKRICLVVSFLDPFIKKSRFLSRPSRDLGDDFLLVTNASLALQTLIPSDGAPLWWKLDHLCFQFKQIDFCLKIMKINCSCYLTYYHGCLNWILCLKPPKFWYRSLILKPGTAWLNITAEEKLDISSIEFVFVFVFVSQFYWYRSLTFKLGTAWLNIIEN